MVALRSILSAVASAALLFQSTSGHSTQRNPITHVTKIDNPSIGTKSHRVNAYSEFDVTFSLHNGMQKIRLRLEPNHDLMPDSIVESILGADGIVRNSKPIVRADHKIYRGSVFVHRDRTEEWSRAGWARITVHRDGPQPLFDGAFRIDGDIHHIQLGKQYQHLKLPEDPTFDDEDGMAVWRDSDIRNDGWSRQELKRDETVAEDICDAESLAFNGRYTPNGPPMAPARGLRSLSLRGLFGRDDIDGGGSGNNTSGGNVIATIGSTGGCPTTRKVALVGIATDCTYWNGFSSQEDLRKQVLSMVNQASEVYESSFNISLGIRNITISEQGCPATASESATWNIGCNPNVDLSARLSDFSSWRGQFKDNLAYWTLLTTCSTQNAVGLAWLGQLCRVGSSSDGGSSEQIAGANVVVKTSTEWQIFAHESGHTFGAIHDCSSSTCPESTSNPQCCPLSSSTCNANGRYIMNPSTGPDITAFSPCSIGQICNNLRGNVNADCLVDNRNVTTITGGQCGNGIVEAGEQCDCGGESGCQNDPCCDPSTCQFRSGAVCDPTNEDCCTDKCQFSSAGTVCRPSTGQCDIAETCSGNNGTCPTDQHRPDGDSCGSNGLECASGQCTSRNLQCQNMASGVGGSNDTSACSADRSCLLSCQSPQYGPGTCVTYNQNFVDGTSCGGGGRCNNGQCEGATTWGNIKYWIDHNKAIFIPVAVIVGLLIIAILLGLLKCCYRRIRGRRGGPVNRPPQMQQNWPGAGVWGRGPGPARGSGPVMSGAGPPEPQREMGPSPPPFSAAPPPIPPQYDDYTNQQPWMRRSGTTRYA